MRVLLLTLLGLAAIGGVAAQGANEQCSSTCSSGYACMGGICRPTAGLPPAGSIGGPCNGGMTGTCNTGAMCLVGICTPSGSSGGGDNPPISIGGGEAGAANGPCRTTGTACNAPLVCVPVFNICGMLREESGDGSGDESGAHVLKPLDASCLLDFECESDYCRLGKCATFTPRSETCEPACSGGKVCRFGFCISPPPTLACAQGQCITGEVCNTTVGLCEENISDDFTCNPPCTGSTTCRKPPIPGFPAYCASSIQCANSGNCQTGFSCNMGRCTPCSGDFCTNAPSEALNLLGLTGVVTAFNQFVSAAATATAIAGGRLEPVAGALVTLTQAIVGSLQTLAFPAERTTAQGAQVDGALTIPAINAANRFAQIAVSAAGALTNTALTVPSAGGLTVALAAGSSPAAPTRARFDQLNLSGPLTIVAAGSNTVLELPTQASGVTVAAGASIKVKGAVALKGSANTAPIVLENVDGAVDRAAVAADTVFKAAGNILGSDAGLDVKGMFEFRGSILEAALIIKAGGAADIAEPASGDLQAGKLSFEDSTAGARTLELHNTDATATASRIYFGEIQDCPTTATVILNVPGQNTRTEALKNGVTFMNYKPVQSLNSLEQFTCALRVCDEAGCTDVANPNAATTGRRLLAAGDAKASWDSEKLSAQTVDGSAAMAVASMTILAALVMAANGLQRLF